MPPKPKAEIMAAMRKRRAEAGIKEVRGIWIPAEHHEKVRQFAKQFAKTEAAK